MQLLKNTVRIGLDRPVRLLHVTDTHLTLADDRDNDRKQQLSRNRKSAFHDENGSVEKYLAEMTEYAEKNCDLLVHTGDLIDFVSAANLETGKRALGQGKWIFAAGNHEFSQYVGEAFEDTNYKMNSFPQVRQGLGTKLLYDSQTVSGVNLIAIDNSYYQFEEWQLERLKIEAEKNIPMILCMHVPIFTPDLYDYSMRVHHGACAYLAGCDERRIMEYSEWHAVQQRPTAATKRFIDYVMNQPLIRCVLAGHIHDSFEGALSDGIMQYVTGGGYDGYARELTLI